MAFVQFGLVFISLMNNKRGKVIDFHIQSAAQGH